MKQQEMITPLQECLRIADLADKAYGGLILDGLNLRDWLENDSLRQRWLDMYDPKISFEVADEKGRIMRCFMNLRTYEVKTYY